MCLATPVKLIKIEENQGTVASNGQKVEVRLDLIDNPKVGDWLLCHADLAVNRVNEEEALEILSFTQSCPHKIT